MNESDSIVYQKEIPLLKSLPGMEEIFNNKKFCDTKITVAKRSILAHRVILAASIPYFYDFFDTKGNDATELVVNEIEPDIIESFINFTYTGKITINSMNVGRYMACANLLRLPEIKEVCANLLISRLKIDNVFKYAMVGNLVNCEHLKVAVRNFVSKNFSGLIDRPEYLSLTFEDFEKIIDLDELEVYGEEEVYKAVIQWVKHHKEVRIVFLSKLLSKIRINFFPVKFLVDAVSTEKLIMESIECRTVLDDIKNKLLLRLANESSYKASEDKPRNYQKHTSQIFIVLPTNAPKSLQNTIKRFENQKWVDVTNFNRTKLSFEVAKVCEKIYLIGGSNDTRTTKFVEVFDTKNNEWSRKQPMHDARSWFGIAASNDSIYVIGGYTNGYPLQTVERYSLSQNKWEKLARLNAPRFSSKAFTLNESVYIIGGSDGKSTYRSCEKYSAKTNEWGYIAEMQHPRENFGAVECKGKIYVCGGFNSNNRTYIKACEDYDPEMDSWTNIASLKEARSNLSVVVLNDKLYAIGGKNVNPLSSIEVYCPVKNLWTYHEPLPEELDYFHAVV